MAGSKVSFRVLLDSIDDVVIALRKNFKILYCNPAFAETTGRKLDTLDGANLLEVFPQLRGTPSYLSYLEVLETGESREVTTQYGNRYLRERIYRTPWGLISIGEDITRQLQAQELVTTSPEDYRAIFESGNDAVFILDPFTGDIRDANSKAVEMFFFARKQLLNFNISYLSSGQPPYTKEDLVQLVKKAYYTQVQPFEWEVKDKSGRLFWVKFRSQRVTFSGQESLLLVATDVTKHKQLKNILRESEERYQQLVDNTNDMIYSHDLEGNFLFVNKAGERITGYWSEELLKMNMEQLVVHDYLQLLRSMVYRRKAKLKENTYELEIMTKYGDRVILDISTWPVYKAGKPIAIQGIARDVTQRKMAEAALEAAQYDARLILDQLPDAVLAVNAEGKVVVWNKAMEEMTGVKAEDMLGKGEYEYGIPFYGAKRPLMVDVVLNPEEVAKYYSIFQYENYHLITEFDAPNLKGVGQYLWGTAAPLKDGKGNTVGAVESLREVTAQRKIREAAEAEFKKQLKQLGAIIDSLDCPVWAIDTNGCISYVNRNSEKIWGYKPEELIGRAFSELIAEPYRQKAGEITSKLTEGIRSSWEIAVCHKEGQQILTQITVTILQEESISGAVIRFSNP